MNLDDQGFQRQDPDISILYNTTESSLQIKQKSVQHFYVNTKPKQLKTKQNNKYIKLLNKSQLIDHKLREQWMFSVYNTNQQAVIFNCCRQDLVAQSTNDNIIFDSQFESGNLDLVIQRSAREFELYMRPDTNTLGHFQWFYFKIRNTQKDRLVKLRIMNFVKPNMLYVQGLKPYVHSKINNSFWQQINQKCVFQEQLNQTFTLSFYYRFEHDDDEVSFASQPPYTYNYLNKFLKQNLLQKPKYLCNSILGFKIPKIQILPQIHKFHSVGIVIARQHPGEAVGSWLVHGFLEKLLKNQNQNIYWVIIPMMNVDGVYLGNSRTGVIGFDVNRAWNLDQLCGFNREKLMPQVISISNLIKSLKNKFGKKVKLFLDFHGHAGKQGVFSYGPPFNYEQNQKYGEARLFPQLIASKSSIFDLSECSYEIPKLKKNAARAIFFQKHKVPFCYTIQATFGLSKGKTLTTSQLIQAGGDIAESAIQFLNYLSDKNSKEQFKDDEEHKMLIERIKRCQNISNDCKQSDNDSDFQNQQLQATARQKLLQKLQGALNKSQGQNNIKFRSITFENLNNIYINQSKLKFSKKLIFNRNIEFKKQIEQNKSSVKREFQQTKNLFLKPLGRFVPKILHIKKSGQPSRLNFTQQAQNPLEKLIGISVDKSKQLIVHDKPSVQRYRKTQILNKITKNKKNMVGSKMLMINEV